MDVGGLTDRLLEGGRISHMSDPCDDAVARTASRLPERETPMTRHSIQSQLQDVVAEFAIVVDTVRRRT
ncbi:MAG: hypothetical protein DLM70_05510 [Chloroflexi bacterium]|nr:MAG: hypothetical protein DLM70_05510 [Chloroflexota bacterium]